jgi:hypothetical protein
VTLKNNAGIAERAPTVFWNTDVRRRRKLRRTTLTGRHCISKEMVNRSALVTEIAATLYTRRLSLRETASAVNHGAFPWKNRLSDDKSLLLLLLRAAKLGKFEFLVGRASWNGLPFLANLDPRPAGQKLRTQVV